MHAPDCPRFATNFARCTCGFGVPPARSPWDATVDAMMMGARAKGYSFTQLAQMIREKWPEKVVSRNAVKGRLERLADAEKRAHASKVLAAMENGDGEEVGA